MKSIKIRAADGASLNVVQSSPEGRKCLLLHGFGDNALVWQHLLRTGIDGYQFYALDFRGHGDSSWNEDGEYALQQFVSDTEEILSSVLGKDEKITMVGHSMGADVALRVTNKFQQKVEQLVIVDYGPSLTKLATKKINSDFAASFKNYTSYEEYVSLAAARLPLADRRDLLSFAKASLTQVEGKFFKLKTDPRLNSMSGAANSELVWSLLMMVECGMTFFRGVGSAVLNTSVYEQMSQIFPASTFNTISQSGHAVMLDNPTEFTKKLAYSLRQK